MLKFLKRREDPLKLTYKELEQHRNRLLKLADQRREEFGNLEKQYETLSLVCVDLQKSNETLKQQADGLEALLKTQILEHYEQADKNAELTRVIADYGAIIDELEQRNAQLLTLLVDAADILKHFPPSKITTQERAGRIAFWIARYEQISDNGRAKEQA